MCSTLCFVGEKKQMFSLKMLNVSHARAVIGELASASMQCLCYKTKSTASHTVSEMVIYSFSFLRFEVFSILTSVRLGYVCI